MSGEKAAMRLKCQGCQNVFLAPVEGMPLHQAAEILRDVSCPRCGGGSSQLFMTEGPLTDTDEPRAPRVGNGDEIVDVEASVTEVIHARLGPKDGDTW
jgi:hypothetical protein